MKIIVGLGNPGSKYEKTRHNTGFMVIDKVLEKLNLTLDKEKFKALYTIYNHNGEKVYIVKPQTFMNLSGEAVKPLMDYYDLTSDDLIVVHDDLDLPVGKLRLRVAGSAGGQKGMNNIIDQLGGNKNIKRIRVGIGNNKLIDTCDYVLGKVLPEDEKVFAEAIDKASDALIASLDTDFNLVMNKYNS